MHRPSMKQPTTVYLTNLMLVIPKFKELDRDKCETYALFITVKVSVKQNKSWTLRKSRAIRRDQKYKS